MGSISDEPAEIKRQHVRHLTEPGEVTTESVLSGVKEKHGRGGAALGCGGPSDRPAERRGAVRPHSVKKQDGPERVRPMVGCGTRGLAGNYGKGAGHGLRKSTIGRESVP